MSPQEAPFRAHFRVPRGVGKLPPPAASGRADNLACGDHLELWIAIEAERITQARFLVRGCSAVIAMASLACEQLAGRTPDEAAQTDWSALAADAGATPRDLAHAPHVVARALTEALAAHRSRCQA
jgi:NifU-like protein involved in Fe-S cluster formation